MAQVILLLTIVWATSSLARDVSELMIAVQRGNTSLVARLIKRIPIDSRDPKARTAIHNAIIHNQAEVLEVLIANDADPNIIDVDGNSPYDLYTQTKPQSENDAIGNILRNAGSLTAKEIAKELDRADANSASSIAIAERNADMLFKAAEDGDREAIELLLAAGTNPKAKNSAGEFPFHLAVKNRHFACCAILLKAIGGVNGGDNKSWTPLHWALLAKDWEMVRELIDEGATIRYRPSTHYRPRQDAYDIAELTKQEDLFVATVLAAETNGMVYSLMEKASRQDNKLGIYQKLVDNGLDLQDEDIAGYAAMYALSYADAKPEVIDFLLANNINKRVLSTKFSSSKVLNSSEIMKKMFDYGADPNALDSSGRTALMAAISYTTTRPYMLKMLLENGADPNLAGTYGATPLVLLVELFVELHVASNKHYSNIDKLYEFMQILLEHGADPNTVSRLRNKTVLDILSETLHKWQADHKNGYNESNLLTNINTLRKMIDLLVANGANRS